MAPELLVPGEFGQMDTKPTPQVDIYAFELSIFQAREPDYGYRPLSRTLSPGPDGWNPAP